MVMIVADLIIVVETNRLKPVTSSCFGEHVKNRSRDRRKQASSAREPEIVKPNSQTSVGLAARRCHLTTPTRPPRLD